MNWWTRLRCRLRGHPLYLSVTTPAENRYSCQCGDRQYGEANDGTFLDERGVRWRPVGDDRPGVFRR